MKKGKELKIKKVNDIPAEDVSMYGSIQTKIEWIWGKDDNVPNFALRRFTIHPGGEIGLHSHPEEHQIFILTGKGLVFNDKDQEFIIVADDSLYVPPGEAHGYKNTGDSDLIFLCVIPLLAK